MPIYSKRVHLLKMSEHTAEHFFFNIVVAKSVDFSHKFFVLMPPINSNCMYSNLEC